MKKLLAFTFAALLCISSQGSFAAEEKSSHYEGAEVHSDAEAVKIIDAKTKEMASIIKANKLDDENMERIHEMTYEIEDAVAFLNKSPKMDFTSFSNNLEGIHLNSESHQPGIMKTYFKVFQKDIVTFQKAYNVM